MRLRLGLVEHDLTTRALVMGVLAADVPVDARLAQADQMVASGADLLDVGRAGAPVAAAEEEELDRVATVVAALRSRFDVPLAIETWRPTVLVAACAAGAAVGRDESGFADEGYLPAAARAGATVVATHARLRLPAPGPGAPALVEEVRAFLQERVRRAEAAGLPIERIVVDAGLDLGKTPAQSLTLLRESAALADLGPPLLLGPSSRYLGVVLGLEVQERGVAAHAAAALAVARGCRIVRTTDVRGARRVADVLDAVLGARLAQVERAVAASDA